jgi:hypothetical protein
LKIKWITFAKISISNYPFYSDFLIGAEIRYPSGVEGYLKTGLYYFNATGDISVS